MRSKSVAQLLVDLDVTKTHSRPHVSDDNPYSEAQFKTLKYRPDFPVRFGSIEDARAHCQEFFRWYNTEHRHSSIALMPPDTVHYGRSNALSARRGLTLDAAFIAHPARFKGISPHPPRVPLAVWINPPKKDSTPPIITSNCSLNSSINVSQTHDMFRFEVERHIRGKWVCRRCERLIQAPVPPHVIDKGIPTAGLLAQVLIAKYLECRYRHSAYYAASRNIRIVLRTALNHRLSSISNAA